MPNRIIQRRRGKGTLRFKSPGHRFISAVSTRKYDEIEKSGVITGLVKELYNDVGKNAPMMLVIYDNKDVVTYPAPIGIVEGTIVESGANAKVAIGNVLPLSKIPDGTIIYGIEKFPGSGPIFIRTSGVSAKLLSHDAKGVIVELPSKHTKIFINECRAIIGKIAGGGRTEKPFVKAANKRYALEARNKKHPRVKGTCMNPGLHPHGGGQRRKRKNYTVSRNAPPGAKVGSIAPKRTGRRQK